MSTGTVGDTKVLRVLLIEDDNWLAESYLRALQQFECRLSTDSQQAIQQVNDWLPDCIVADIVLPGGLVIDLLHELQSYGDTKTIPVIICSSIAAKYRLEDLASYGVVALCDKAALRPQQLLQYVERALAA